MKIKPIKVLALIAEYEILDNLEVDSITIGDWFQELSESEKFIIEKYQEIRVALLDRLVKLNHQQLIEYGKDTREIPDFFEIGEN